jgi:hypothetical protein
MYGICLTLYHLLLICLPQPHRLLICAYARNPLLAELDVPGISETQECVVYLVLMEVGKSIHQQHGRRDRRNLWDKIWKDRAGHIVIWQMPNVPLIAWVVLTVISLVLNTGTAADVSSWLASTALIIWCLLEIFKGADYFRRVLGLAVLIMATATLFHSL